MSGAWKSLEKLAAEELKGTRVLRGADFSKSDVDVVIEDFDNFRVDCKYRQKWAHHKFLDEIEEKYGRVPLDMPVLVTKHHKQRGAVVAMRLEHFALILDTVRELRKLVGG